MKILFLDIDGVLNCERTSYAFGKLPHDVVGYHRDLFDEVAIRLIRGIVDLADACIVLSSSWRLDPNTNHHEVANGLDLPIIDSTPVLYRDENERGHEIAAWLKKHPEVERYVIVDDADEFLEEQQPFFVQTSGFDGLTWANASKICELLGVSIFNVNKSTEPKVGW